MVGGGASRRFATGGGSLQQFFSEVLQGLGAPVSDVNLAKLGAIAKVEGNNSGTFNPFNSTGGEFPNKFNSVGVENYPDWATGVQYTVRQMQRPVERDATGLQNLLRGGSYAEWQQTMGAFYRSWGGSHGATCWGGSRSRRAHRCSLTRLGWAMSTWTS